jgi:hypothetical protein
MKNIMMSFMNLDERSPEALKTVIDKHNKAKRLLFKIMNERIENGGINLESREIVRIFTL